MCYHISFYKPKKRVLIAADDALNSAVEVGDGTTIEVDKKFGEAIDLLSAFEKDFPSKDSTSDPNIGATSSVTSEAMMSEYSGSPLTVLGALKKNIHSKVKLPPVFFFSTLMNFSLWAIMILKFGGTSRFVALGPFPTPTLSL